MTTPDADKKIEDRIEFLLGEIYAHAPAEDEELCYYVRSMKSEVLLLQDIKRLREALRSAPEPTIRHDWDDPERACNFGEMDNWWIMDRQKALHQSNQAHLGDA